MLLGTPCSGHRGCLKWHWGSLSSELSTGSAKKTCEETKQQQNIKRWNTCGKILLDKNILWTNLGDIIPLARFYLDKKYLVKWNTCGKILFVEKYVVKKIIGEKKYGGGCTCVKILFGDKSIWRNGG